jgi:thymidylate kinase
MIATLERPGRTIAATDPVRPLVVELVGPAGAGKSSLLLALGAGDRKLRAGLRVPRQRHLATALTLTPTFLALHRPYRGLLWKEMKRITYLGSLYELLQERSGANAGTVLLDEGAVYMLARLEVLGAERTHSAAYARWWHGAIEAWSRTLDLIVWLDAPDPVLRDRLRRRAQSHPVKRRPDEAIDRFIASYRDSYRHVIRSLMEARGPRLLTVRTDQEDVECIARQLTAEVRDMEAGP